MTQVALPMASDDGSPFDAMTLTVHVGPRPLAEQLAELRTAGIADPCPACFGPRTNGRCRACQTQHLVSTDHHYSALADARARLDFGAWSPTSDRPYTLDDARADQALVARLEAKMARAERDARADPNGCALCGVPQRDHAQRWHGPQQPRTYVAPSNALRLDRMYARRAKRVGLPVWARPKWLPSCPYCRRALPGLLATCWRQVCLRAEIAADHRAARAEDL